MRPETPHLFNVGLDDPGDRFRRYPLGVFLVLASVLGLSLLIDAPLQLIEEMVPEWKGPASVLLSVTLVAAVCPVLAGIVEWLHQRPWTTLLAAEGRPDVAAVFKSAAIWGTILIGVAVITAIAAPDLRPAWRGLDVSFALLGLVPLLAVMLVQAAAVEMFFRSYLVQAFRRLSGSMIILAFVSSHIFAVLNAPNWIDGMWLARAAYFTSGVFLFAVTWRTGRLEAAIGINFAQNVMALLIIGGFGDALPGVLDGQRDLSGSIKEGLLAAALISALAAIYWFFAFGLGWVAPRRKKGSGPVVTEPLLEAE